MVNGHKRAVTLSCHRLYSSSMCLSAKPPFALNLLPPQFSLGEKGSFPPPPKADTERVLSTCPQPNRMPLDSYGPWSRGAIAPLRGCAVDMWTKPLRTEPHKHPKQSQSLAARHLPGVRFTSPRHSRKLLCNPCRSSPSPSGAILTRSVLACGCAPHAASGCRLDRIERS